MSYTGRKRSSKNKKNPSADIQVSTSKVAHKQKNQNSKSYTTRGSLHSAVQAGKETVVKILLSRGLSVNVTDTLERTLLHVASLKGNDSMVKLLLKRGAAVDARDNQGLTPIHLAADAGHLEIFKLLLRTPGADGEHIDINIKTNNDQTPLHFTALNGHLSLIKYIMRNGGEVNIIEKNCYTPLLLAVIGSHPKAVQELVKHIPDPSVKAQYKKLIFVAASGDAHLLTLSHQLKVLLRQKKMSVDKQLKCAEIIDILLDTEWQFIDEQVNGATPLYCALNYRHDLIVQKLIERGCDINMVCKNGRSALHKAAYAAHPKVLKILLDAGADFKKRCKLGLLPIHYMALSKNYRNLSILIQAGADINGKTAYNETIIEVFRANQNSSTKQVLFLYVIFRYGLDLNATDNYGNTPLQTLFLSYNCELTCILLDWYLDFNIVNKDGNTLLENAILYSKDSDERAKFIIRMMLVMERKTKFKISTLNMTAITSNSYLDFYEQCKQELDDLKVRKVWGKISFVEFLEKPLRELRKYTRNDELMRVINSGVLNSFLLYGDLMKHRISFALRLQDIHDKSYNFLKKSLYPRHLPYLVGCKILEFLNDDEVEKLSLL